MRLVIDLEPEVQPLRGRLERADGPPVAFTGILELVAALQAIVAPPPPPHGAAPAD